MDEYDYYDDCDRFERDDDYNVYEERELMADEQWHEASGFEEEFDDYLDSEAADFDADWREEA